MEEVEEVRCSNLCWNEQALHCFFPRTKEAKYPWDCVIETILR